MKRQAVFTLIIIAVTLAIALVIADAQPAPLPVLEMPDFSQFNACPVIEVTDGDTIVVNDKGKEIRVRLVGVDTPETVHPTKVVEYYGKEASLFTKNLLKGEKVYLVSDQQPSETDRYGRILAYVYRVPDGLFVNAEIIRQGYGHAYTQFPFKYMEEFRQLERFAREAEKGLWSPDAAVQNRVSDTTALSTEDTDRPEQSRITDYPYVASAEQDIFHKPSCKWAKKIKPENLVGFKTRQDAIRSNRRPCKVCNS